VKTPGALLVDFFDKLLNEATSSDTGAGFGAEREGYFRLTRSGRAAAEEASSGSRPRRTVDLLYRYAS